MKGSIKLVSLVLCSVFSIGLMSSASAVDKCSTSAGWDILGAQQMGFRKQKDIEYICSPSQGVMHTCNNPPQTQTTVSLDQVNVPIGPQGFCAAAYNEKNK